MATFTDSLPSTATTTSTMGFPQITAAVASTAAGISALTAARQAVAEVVAAAVGTSSMGAVRLTYLTLASEATAGDVMSLQALLHGELDAVAVAQSLFPNVTLLLQLPGGGAEESQGMSTWVVNAETAASSRYEQFEFNSFAHHAGVHYAFGADGIYRLGGATDAGDAIRAMVAFGKTAFGTPQLKRVPYAYIGVSSEDVMYLKLRLADKEYIYRTRGHSMQMGQQRFDVGRGLVATYWEFELYNADGADFTLDTVEFVPVTLERRIP